MTTVRHKVFISYHHKDQREVENFVNRFDQQRKIFITKALGMGIEQDIIDSNNTEYVMRRIRELYLQDSTVTIVLMGRCTWARRYVDWEIQSSLRAGEKTIPNGLLGVKLSSCTGYPNRLNLNLKQSNHQSDCYARGIKYPANIKELYLSIEDAYQARTKRRDLIVNPRERLEYNKSCS